MSDDALTNDQRRGRRWRRLMVGVPTVTFACVLLAMAAGAPAQRWGPVAAFLGLATAAAIYLLAEMLLMRRRARRQRDVQLPWGTRLKTPLWMSLSSLALPIEGAALLAAVAAALGSPGAGVGVLLTFLGLAGFASFSMDAMSPRALTLEPGGLRVHLRRASFVVPWASITRVERVGPGHTQMILLHIADVDAVARSVEPSTPRAVEQIATTCIRDAGRPDGRLMLIPGSAGLAGPTLARAIEEGRAGRIGRTN